ncbi:Mycothiol S-conjugate amidase [Streptomyces sp. YIM 130001]|uniref:PIG-L deacetylase family protein n=1 Tax=Streptomyces sp. YIM 130001 TaxID=2259644 RepID=UPI000E65D8D0|nr:PIG-L family deacetylase [Streptomyces sp. YIM 130001]RII17666.1 Mycothiol S-conjugate amidase [Streptomyces sp. YIM 130001]
MTLPSLLAVFAHPDDESLAAGGVVARHAASGARTAIVTATWAEGTPRAAELADAVRLLGAGHPRLLGYADARVPESAPGRPRLCEAPLDEAVCALVAHIREVRPRIVVTHDALGGLTGHPDHVHTHRVCLIAARAAGLAELYPQAGEPWQPDALYAATHPRSAVGALGAKVPRAAERELRTVPDEWITATVDVRPWLEAKYAAILAHRSEVTRGAAPGILAAMPEADRSAFLSTEYYIRHDLDPAARSQRTGLTG